MRREVEPIARQSRDKVAMTPDTEVTDITRMLHDWQNGDSEALDRLAPIVYDELDRIARRYMCAESPSHTLQPTALVNEAFVRLVQGKVDYKSRKHFFVIAARMMRRVLVDHARHKVSDKRGGGMPALTLDESLVQDGDDGAASAILDLDQAITRLSQSDARMAEAIELVYFGGLSAEEAANLLGVSRTTMFDDLRFAKAWLRTQLEC